MIYDGFLFFNELDLLEIRLNELDSVVDRFVLVESNVTFSGKSKPMIFAESRHLFERFLPKIIYAPAVDLPGPDTWAREAAQRNAIFHGVPATAKDDDLLIVADLDEIPRASALRAALPITKTMAFRMDSYGSYVNSPSGSWSHTKIVPLAVFRNGSSPQEVRHASNLEIPNGGWHFSYVGGPDRICQKMSAFSHQEAAVQKFNDKAALERNLAVGAGVFGGRLSFVPLDATFPEYLVRNADRFRHLIGQSTPEV